GPDRNPTSAPGWSYLDRLLVSGRPRGELVDGRVGRGNVARVRIVLAHQPLDVRGIDIAHAHLLLQRQHSGERDRLPHRHARRDLTRALLRVRGGRVVPPGDQQLVDIGGHQRAIRVVVVPTAGDGVLEVTALNDI